MNKLEKLLARNGALLEEMRPLADKEELTEEEVQQYEKMEAEFDANEKDIQRMYRLTDKEKNAKLPSNAPVYPQGGINGQPPQNEQKFSSFGEQLFAVMQAASPSRNQVDPRLGTYIRGQAGLNEGVPSEGGFLVQTDFVNELLAGVYNTGALVSRAKRRSITGNANGMTINAFDETSRASGSRYGGMQLYWLHEAGTKTPSAPSFRQIELKLKKIIGLYYATDELLQDVGFLQQEVNEAFTEEMAWEVDDAIFRGTGVGMPLGITGHAATVVVTAEPGQAANTILYENIVNMWSRMVARSRANAVWFVNQDIEPQLFTMSLAVGVGGVPVYMPAGGASAAPYGTLMGRPVIPIEQASTLGTVGDITLADLSQYRFVDKAGIQTASSIHVQFLTDQTAFRFVYRCDGQPYRAAALTPANGTNTLSPVVQLETR